MQKVYIAYSIAGSNQFIVATKSLTNKAFKDIGSDEKTSDFSIAKSRRPEYNADTDGIKLHWTALTKKDGSPIMSAPIILRHFKKLEEDGWKIIGRDEFIAHHWKKKH